MNLRKNARVMVKFDNYWEPATYLKHAAIKGCIVVKRDGDPWQVQVSEKDVRPFEDEPSQTKKP